MVRIDLIYATFDSIARVSFLTESIFIIIESILEMHTIHFLNRRILKEMAILHVLMSLVLSRLMCGPYSNNLQTLYHYWVETRDPRTIEERKRMKRWGRSQALKEQIDESDNQTSKLTDLSLYIYI